MKSPWLRVLPHIFLWLVLVLYFFNADEIYAEYFLKNGKPYDLRVEEPVQQGSYDLQLINLTALRYDGQDIYEVAGSAVTPQGILPEKFEMWLVLQEGERQYVFPLMQGRYLEIDNGLVSTIVNARLAREAIEPGNYLTGFFIKDTKTGQENFFWLSSIIRFTHNSIKMEHAWMHLIHPAAVDPTLPPKGDQIHFQVDGISSSSLLREEIQMLWGWFFARNAKTLVEPEGFIILAGEEHTYQLGIEPQSRPGVLDAFPMEAPGEHVGFRAYIDRSIIPAGKYRVGILITSQESKPLFTLTDKFLLVEEDGLTLETAAPAQLQPVKPSPTATTGAQQP